MTGGAHTITGTYSGDTNFATSNTTPHPDGHRRPQQPPSSRPRRTTHRSVSQSPTPATVTPTSLPFPITGTVGLQGRRYRHHRLHGPGRLLGGIDRHGHLHDIGRHHDSRCPLDHRGLCRPVANYATSTSSTFTQTVVQGTTSTTVNSSANPTTAGLALTYTATVTIIGGSAIVPAGTVAFSDAQQRSCAPPPPVTSQTATCIAPQHRPDDRYPPHHRGLLQATPTSSDPPGTLSQVVTTAPITVAVTSDGSPSGLAVPRPVHHHRGRGPTARPSSRAPQSQER